MGGPDTTHTPQFYKDLADIVEYLFPGGTLDEDDNGQLVIHTGLKWDIDGRLCEANEDSLSDEAE